MKIEKPLVSVLMTAYNREKYIAEAIESVLRSTYTNFELIIVDDKSKDGTVDIAKSYAANDNRVKVFINDVNLGDYPNRNKAAYYAKGKYIKYLDSDDVIYPHGLDVMVGSINQFPDVAYGASSAYSLRPLPVLMSPRESYLEHFFGSHHFDRSPGSLIINREIFCREGGFTGKRMIGDYEFLLNYSLKYNIVLMPVQLYWSRRHEEQESSHSKDYKELREQILNQALNDPLCPLTISEKKILRKIKIRNKVMSKTASLIKKLI
ncbi:hypothetical protein GCM10027443_13870 [Pontibacter brevis]